MSGIFRPLVTVLFWAVLTTGSSAFSAEKPKTDFGVYEFKPGVSAHAFNLPDAHGKKISLADFKGKAVVLNFWATWCSPCIAELPGLTKLHETYKDKGLIVVGLSADTDLDPVLQSIDRFKLPFQVIIDTQGNTVLKYGARALPTTYLIKANGEMFGSLRGARNWESAAAREWMDYFLGESVASKPMVTK